MDCIINTSGPTPLNHFHSFQPALPTQVGLQVNPGFSPYFWWITATFTSHSKNSHRNTLRICKHFPPFLLMASDSPLINRRLRIPKLLQSLESAACITNTSGPTLLNFFRITFQPALSTQGDVYADPDFPCNFDDYQQSFQVIQRTLIAIPCEFADIFHHF